MEPRPFRLLAIGVGAATVFAACLAVGQSLDSLGYLHGAHAPDTAKILQAAPATDSPRGVADRAIYRATRALKDTPRCALAQNDVNESIPAMLKDFSCGAGATLTETNAPRLVALLGKVRADVLLAVNKPKALYQRQRPYLIDTGEICVPRTESLDKSPDYPSGHATWGWTLGLVLAEADPDRAAEILVRARAFGESRVVCGVHNASAIEAARTNASAVAAALNGDAAFRSDLEAARGEIAAARAKGAPPAQACSAEAALTAATPW